MARIIDAFTQFFDNAGDPLVNGKLQFLESGTNNTDKNTFKDSAMTPGLENTNPVILDGAGRCSSVFGSGVYNVISFTSDDVQIQQFDPVGASSSGAQFDIWDASQIYDEGDIVRGSDGEYYQSFINSNSNNNPTTSPTKWDLITIVKSYIADASGTADVITADFTPIIHSLTNNIRVLISATAANASTVPTFAPNGLTAKVIVKSGNQPLIAGDIGGSGHELDMVYRSGTDKWELLNPSTTNYLPKSPSSTENDVIVFSSDGGAKDSGVQMQREANAGGSADALTATFSPALPSPLIDKVQVKVRALLANATTTPTFNGDTIVKNGDQPLAAGDIFGPGHMLIMDYNLANTNWELLNPVTNNSEIFIVQDQRVSGTNAGSSVAGIQTRPLNTVVVDSITGASLLANQVTLPAGDYKVTAAANAYITANAQIGLYNVTDAVFLLAGANRTSNTSALQLDSTIDSYISIAGTKVLELRQYTQLANASDGLGIAVSSGILHELYATLAFEKIG